MSIVILENRRGILEWSPNIWRGVSVKSSYRTNEIMKIDGTGKQKTRVVGSNLFEDDLNVKWLDFALQGALSAGYKKKTSPQCFEVFDVTFFRKFQNFSVFCLYEVV